MKVALMMCLNQSILQLYQANKDENDENVQVGLLIQSLITILEFKSAAP